MPRALVCMSKMYSICKYYDIPNQGTYQRAPTEQGADYLRIEEYVKHWFKWVRTGIGAWINNNENKSIKKHPHPSANEECRCLCNESSNYLAFINSFLFTSASYFCSCESH